MATGKVRVVYKNRAVLGPESIWAAQANLCAGEQAKFWEYHDKVYESWKGVNQGAFAKDKLKGFAADLGLDVGQFSQCLDSNKYESQVREETAESERRGVTGTPTFFINNTKLEGAQPFANFRAAIETELQRAK